MSSNAKTLPVGVTAGQEFVKGLGLTSATTLVMGGMIGSGIYIVSADIARLVDSPVLLIAAWLITGFMTITGALAIATAVNYMIIYMPTSGVSSMVGHFSS